MFELRKSFKGKLVRDRTRIPERRNWRRLDTVYPSIYTRFDDQGRPDDQKPCKTIDVSPGGVKLRSSFSVNPGEMLDVAMALGANSINFKGVVTYVEPSGDQNFELGVSIEEIDNQDMVALSRFIYYFNPYSENEREKELDAY